jgi:hypothetical protein
MLRTALVAVTGFVFSIGTVQAAELPAKVRAKRVHAVVVEGVTQQVEVWGPAGRTRLAFYDLTDPYWIRPMCLKGTRVVYVR